MKGLLNWKNAMRLFCFWPLFPPSPLSPWRPLLSVPMGPSCHWLGYWMEDTTPLVRVVMVVANEWGGTRSGCGLVGRDKYSHRSIMIVLVSILICPKRLYFIT